MPLSISVIRPVRVGGAVAGATALVVAGPALAGAHVTVNPGEAPAGSYTVLTVAVPHGCETSGTTEVAIEIPEEILAVTPTVHANWDVVRLAANGSPAEAGGSVAQVVYSAHTPLPHDLRDAFELSVRLPDEAGQTLAFPVVQSCEDGQAAWVEIAADDEDPHDLEYPAPLVEITEPVDDGHGAETAAGDDTAEEDSSAGSGTEAMTVAGFGTGLAGVVLGGAALVYAHRRTRSGDHPAR
ncbi:YcnI family protein [Phytoactinopolyspora alkaliphila]|uniref:YcnI family protein n=1 Tax=Phytoactinopolyspora alkaliphila TaxID=1783498 RepID=A0A6N9YIT9_9ACTN|nr:YcnI family protein [Phytoactinopolyspora alkaliphila]NED94872.1 YcnI family protein [Phytoactinopolyspora alkaliphila]